MTRERIEDFREIVLPFLSRTLLKTNYENMGKSDAEEFEKDFNEILDMAIKALEQEPKTGHWIDDKCSVCGKGIEDLISSREWYRNEEPNLCPFCGAKMQAESEVTIAMERNTTTEQEIVKPYLDRIKAEIMQLDYDCEDVDYDYNDMAQTEVVHTICREEVLRIIDKYRGDADDQS